MAFFSGGAVTFPPLAAGELIEHDVNVAIPGRAALCLRLTNLALAWPARRPERGRHSLSELTLIRASERRFDEPGLLLSAVAFVLALALFLVVQGIGLVSLLAFGGILLRTLLAAPRRVLEIEGAPGRYRWVEPGDFPAQRRAQSRQALTVLFTWASTHGVPCVDARPPTRT
jgi:hypothetical protein